MSTTTADQLEAEADRLGSTIAPALPEPSDNGPDGSEPDEAAEEEQIFRVALVAGSAALSCSAAGWMLARLFNGGPVPLLIAATGVAIGVGLVSLSLKSRSALLQLGVIPLAAVVGAVLATTGAGQGGSLPTLVLDAIRGGGLLQPPIPLDPGWRFLLVLLPAVIAAAALATAAGLNRPKLAVGIPLPVVLGGALLQPEGSELLASAVAMALVVASLALAYGADLAAEGGMGGGFELRRLLRGASLMLAVLVVLGALAQTNFLFPDTDKDQVIPPRKPPIPPPTPDRVLFTVKTDRNVPWRLGVLDVYDQDAFLLPSIDPKRVIELPKSGVVGKRGAGAAQTFRATVRIAGVKGQSLPAPASPAVISGIAGKLEYDPRTQVIRRAKTSLSPGLDYTVVAPVPPDAKQLVAALPLDPLIKREFTAMPPPPPGVVAALAAAPTANLFDRLQFMRAALYGRVVAAGAGRPVDIVPAKVDAMLAGGQASPFEINAAEVMLARWAGIPARLGFGFYNGDPVESGVEFRPKHGAAWLEAYFQGSGWVPILGTPPKAKASLSNEDKKQDEKTVASAELALTVFVPIRLQSLQLLYTIVRYWVSVLGPYLLALVLLVITYPAGLKLARRRRRRRWAAPRGAPARIVVAYAEFRDRCYDLNIGDPRDTALEFLTAVDDDHEHEELAWLFTRVVYGDLARDVQLEDVEAAEELGRSVTKRVVSEQTGLNRCLGLISRVSLRDPWSDEVPNLWWRRGRAVPRPYRAAGRVRRLLPATAIATALIVAVVAVVSVFPSNNSAPTGPIAAYPRRVVPTNVLGYDVERQATVEDQYKRARGAALVSDGRVFTIRSGASIQGAFQVARFKPGVEGSDERIQGGVERGLGSAEGFVTHRFGTVRLRVLQLNEQQVFLWFPSDRNIMELFIMRKQFGDAEAVVRSIIAYQQEWEKP